MGRWQLAREMRRLRGDRPVAEVAKAMRMTVAAVHRWETAGPEGMVPSSGTMARLLEYYAIDGEEAAWLRHLREQARKRGWWQSYTVDKYYGTMIGLEETASRIQLFGSQLVPGLLQTREYAHAVVRATCPDESADVIDQRVEVRMQRQKRWASAESPKLWAIVGETVIRQRVGGTRVMAEQLTRMIELADSPKLHLQVIPYSVGGHAALEASAFQILRLDEIDLSVIYLESRRSSLYLEEQADIDDYQNVFDHLRTAGLGTVQTRELLVKVRDEMRKE
ncbi:helix-turn-helix domain-containing protein [Marinactinospora rubrisoli]|uniref:Helix-turn-helix domain-containing protein n=1 Tax=Marinactinospora rubrisoli TaxID=2715399 RepID=A0ABW2KJK0_9ACTN